MDRTADRKDPVNLHTALIVGPPRSGTTLLCRLLASGPETLGLSEPFHMRRMLPLPLLQGFFQYIKWRNPTLRHLPPPRRCNDAAYLDYLRRLATRNGKSQLVLKELFHERDVPESFRNIELFERLAKHEISTLAIIRHPADAVASLVALLRWLLTSWRRLLIRTRWTFPQMAWTDHQFAAWAAMNWAHFAEWTWERNLFVVRYEELTARPGPTLRRVCERAGLTFDPWMVEHHRHRPGGFGGVGSPEVIFKSDQAIHCRSVGRGRQLPRQDYDMVAEICGPQADMFGYRFERSGASETAADSKRTTQPVRAVGQFDTAVPSKPTSPSMDHL